MGFKDDLKSLKETKRLSKHKVSRAIMSYNTSLSEQQTTTVYSFTGVTLIPDFKVKKRITNKKKQIKMKTKETYFQLL